MSINGLIILRPLSILKRKDKSMLTFIWILSIFPIAVIAYKILGYYVNNNVHKQERAMLGILAGCIWLAVIPMVVGAILFWWLSKSVIKVGDSFDIKFEKIKD